MSGRSAEQLLLLLFRPATEPCLRDRVLNTSAGRHTNLHRYNQRVRDHCAAQHARVRTTLDASGWRICRMRSNGRENTAARKSGDHHRASCEDTKARNRNDYVFSVE